jgi:pimeloyl-ACP methyl ester carboxylesterase
MTRPLLILIHGSWLGGWCWKSVRAELSRLGIVAEAPTLTALGNRGHLGGTKTGLHAHVSDILEHLRFVDSEDVVLVGHSYGAVVAAEAAASRPDMIKGLIVLDGFILSAGRSIFDQHPELQAAFRDLIHAERPGLIQPPSADFLGLPACDDTNLLIEKLRPMPLRSHTEPCLTGEDSLQCARYYVQFTDFPFFASTASRARGVTWQVSGIAAGHMAIHTAPQLVADRITEILEQLP